MHVTKEQKNVRQRERERPLMNERAFTEADLREEKVQ